MSEADNNEFKMEETIYDQYPEDTDRIIVACKENGVELTRKEAIYYWSEYSDMLAAGWLILPETNEEIYSYIKPLIEEGRTIVEFKKRGKGVAEVAVTIYDSTVGEVMVGIAETIHIIMENTKVTKKDIIGDIEKILGALIEEKKEGE